VHDNQPLVSPAAAGEVENAMYGFDGVGDVDHLLEKF
jgi:hypothetical protein